MYLIYKLTNPHNNKSYIGLTKDLDGRIKNHKSSKTVECKDFDVDVVFDNIPSLDEANEMEKVYIDVYDTYENGYNNTLGGGYRKTSKTKKTRINDARIILMASLYFYTDLEESDIADYFYISTNHFRTKVANSDCFKLATEEFRKCYILEVKETIEQLRQSEIEKARQREV